MHTSVSSLFLKKYYKGKVENKKNSVRRKAQHVVLKKTLLI